MSQNYTASTVSIWSPVSPFFLSLHFQLFLPCLLCLHPCVNKAIRHFCSGGRWIIHTGFKPRVTLISPYCSVQYTTVQCIALQSSVVHYSAVYCTTVKCSALQCGVVQYSTIQCIALQYNWLQRGEVQCKCSMVHYCTLYTTVHCTLLYIVHYCTIHVSSVQYSSNHWYFVTVTRLK